jgi:hypothetical protein
MEGKEVVPVGEACAVNAPDALTSGARETLLVQVAIPLPTV